MLKIQSTKHPFIQKVLLFLPFLFIRSLSADAFQLQLPQSPFPAHAESISSQTNINQPRTTQWKVGMSKLSSSTSSSDNAILSWDDLKEKNASQSVGSALNNEAEKRKGGKGSAHVQSKLRLFNSEVTPKITLYRDHAGWCPYCQKTMLLIEEKGIPINIELVPMRSYGDKPTEFTRIVPSGLLPAISVEMENGRKQAITESQVIMELLDKWHPATEGYKTMLPEQDDIKGLAKYDQLARLERELFSWWCTLIFRPEGPPSLPGGLMGMLGGNKGSGISGSMQGFLDCMSKVEKELSSTSGPWFYKHEYPTMIDFVFVSHVERMLASCAYWKGLNLRSEEMKKKYPALNLWLDSFEKKEYYLAFKSDYYTHVKDIPPQYGPGYDGGFEDQRESYSKSITGKDGKSWNLPLPHDDPVQPLYRGPPLPLCVLESAGISPDSDGTYENADPDLMAKTCRNMAGWKLAGNGENVSKFAARGGQEGARNPRKSFGAELADPYANSDENALPYVDASLRVVCKALSATEETEVDHLNYLKNLEDSLTSQIPSEKRDDVINSLAYLRDRVGVPRDLPLAAGRQLRAHLNWAIGVL
mmetsp:Transcript_7119/g.8096  ORF Transcript_7119/g.8096 Transcript_7119/m.8096 type:complete len:588 (+) Transcript_7119:216-1979(+)